MRRFTDRLDRLAAIAELEPDLREEIAQYAAALRSVPAPTFSTYLKALKPLRGTSRCDLGLVDSRVPRRANRAVNVLRMVRRRTIVVKPLVQREGFPPPLDTRAAQSHHSRLPISSTLRASGKSRSALFVS